MGRFAKVHPEERRLAVVRAVLDDDLSQAEVRRLGKAGELAGLQAFEVSAATVSGWVNREQRAREPRLDKLAAEGKTDELLESVAVRLARCLGKDLKRLEEQGSVKRDPKDYEPYAKAARAIASIRPSRVSPSSNAKPKPRQGDNGNGAGGEPSPLLAKLTGQHDEPEP